MECNAKKIPLRKEIELIRHYIELERLRFGNRLALTFEPSIPQDDRNAADFIAAERAKWGKLITDLKIRVGE